MNEELRVSDGPSNPNWNWRDTGITRSHPVQGSSIKRPTVATKFWTDRLWILWCFVSVFLIAAIPNFRKICQAAATSDWTSWENMHTVAHTHTHTHTHISALHLREAFAPFPFPITLSVSNWGSYLPPSYLYSRLMGKFKFGITSDCWPEPISDNWLALFFSLSLSACFEAPHNKKKKRKKEKSHTLLSRHTSLAYLKIPGPWVFYPCFVCMRVEN